MKMQETTIIEEAVQDKPVKPKRSKIEKIFFDLLNAMGLMVTNAIKSMSNLIKTVFKLVFLLTDPIKFIITLVQLLKSRAFSTVVLIGSLAIVGWASINSTTLVLRELYPDWTPEQAKEYAIRILVLLESVLVFFKVNRKKYLSWFTMILVLSFTVGSVGYEVFLDYDKFTVGRLLLMGLVTIVPTVLSTMLMYYSANEVSKIPKNTKLDRPFKKGKKGQRFSMSKEERKILNTQILEHADHQGDSIESFRSIQEVFQDRCKGSGYISNLLRKERPILYEKIKTKQKKGRKTESEKQKESKSFFSNFLSGK
jgi:hypothetical protein